ncbi:MAG: ORF6N domain-containing protein [Candidatus Margulisiibacteriota bacterium]
MSGIVKKGCRSVEKPNKFDISTENIRQCILLIRSQKVMLDSDLAVLYGIRTKELNKAVFRNRKRFPSDFMLRLTKIEHSSLRFQIGTSKRGGRRYLPYVFTEQGIAMLSSVLNSERAIRVNILIMRAFVKLRNIIYAHKEMERKLLELESRIDKHDKGILTLFDAIRQIMKEETKPKSSIGFLRD